MEFLQKYLLIPLDIYRKNLHNKGINSKRDAWLALFSCDEPEVIVELIEKYPEFREIYEESYEICRNTERVMEMFSKELYELDRNTVQYMIDEMQDTIDAQNAELEEKSIELKEKNTELEKKSIELEEKSAELREQETTISEQKTTIEKLQQECENAIRSTVRLLQDFNVPEPEIIERVSSQYQISVAQVRKCL